MNRSLLVSVLVFATSLLVSATHGEGGDKASGFKAFLPEEAYKLLTARSIAAIEGLAKSSDKGADEAIEVEAAILAGYSLSFKDASSDAVSSLRGAALQAAQAARKGEVKKLAAFSKSVASAPKAPAVVKDITAYLQATEPMMNQFRSKAKGGSGIHADLQFQVKLKNLNGIEALLGSLSAKKLTDENLAKIAKEMPLLAYRIAVVGSITHEFKPKKDVAKWREFSLTMRDAAITLAEAAGKKNGDGVLKAALTLENSCTACHSVFKSK